MGVLVSLDLRDFGGDFLHYISNWFWAIGQGNAEVLEQDGEVWFWPADHAQADRLAGPCWQDDVHRANFGHFFQ